MTALGRCEAVPGSPPRWRVACRGAHPVRVETEPERSSASRKSQARNGLYGCLAAEHACSGPLAAAALSCQPGLAHSSQVARSISAMLEISRSDGVVAAVFTRL